MAAGWPAGGRRVAAGWPAGGRRVARGWQVPVWGRCLAGWGAGSLLKTSKNPTPSRASFCLGNIEDIGYIGDIEDIEYIEDIEDIEEF